MKSFKVNIWNKGMTVRDNLEYKLINRYVWNTVWDDLRRVVMRRVPMQIRVKRKIDEIN